MPDRAEEIRNPVVQDILGEAPSWILRWGTTLILAAVLLILVGAWVIHYPEIISARIVVTTANPPVPVMARADGKLILLVEDQSAVAAGAPLAAVENPAHLADVLTLKETLKTLEPLVTRGTPDIDFQHDTHAVLGPLQNAYAAFLQDYSTYTAFHANTYHLRSIQVLEKQLAHYQDLSAQWRQNLELVNREVVLAEKKYEIDRSLFEKSAISELELATSESVFLSKKRELESIQASLINNDIQSTQQQKTILDLEYQYEEKQRLHTLALQTTFKQLKTELLAWEERFLLAAPIDGTVSFFRFWSDNQFVRANEEVLTVVPTDSSDALVGKVFLPQLGAGRVKTGQTVRIKFDSYPFDDFGAVEGRVQSISLIARENQYMLEVSFPNGLKTTYNKTLDLKQEMQGTADIITEDLRLIDRIFNQLRSIFVNAT